MSILLKGENMEYYELKWFCFDPDTGVYHLQNDNLKQEEDEDEE